MSAVSTKIFGSDLALDVKTDFAALYGVGKSVDEINAYILGYCPEDDDEEACIYWSALALIAWEYGVLTEQIKNKAQYIIENHSDAPLFLQKKDETARENELRKLLHLLNTENPNPRKRKKSFVYRTLWKAGDVLALPLYGKYVYLHICAVDRPAGKIKELEEDRVFVQVFDAVTDDLLSVQVLKENFFEMQYKTLDRYCECTTKLLWCNGYREQTALEKKVIFIGNLPAEYEIPKSVYTSVYADFQFSRLENTLCEMFSLS